MGRSKKERKWIESKGGRGRISHSEKIPSQPKANQEKKEGRVAAVKKKNVGS